MPGVPAPAEGVVRAVAEVRGKAVPPASGRAQVDSPHRADGDGVLLPPVVRAVAAVPGALSPPRPPPAWPSIPLAPPGLPGRPPTEKRRAFAIHPHDFFADEPRRHIGRASLPLPAAADAEPDVPAEADAARVDDERRAGASALGVDGERRAGAGARVDGQWRAGGSARADGQWRAEAGARVDEQELADAGARAEDQGRAQGRAPGFRPDGSLDRAGRSAAGALVELRRPRRPDEQKRDDSGGGAQVHHEQVHHEQVHHEQVHHEQIHHEQIHHEQDRHEQGRRGLDRHGQDVGELERGGRASDGLGGGGLLRPAVPLFEARPAMTQGAVEERSQGGGRGANPVRKKRLRQAALPVVAAGVAAFVVGTGYLAVSDRGGDSDLGRWGPQAVAAPVTVEGKSAGDPFGAAAAVPVGAPSRLRVKAVGIDTSLENLHLATDGALVPPNAYGRAGWYSGGTVPGDVGPAVIAGHVDSKSGPAIFYRLRELTVGDRIEVVRGRSVVRFTVVRVAWYPKTRFPTGEVYGPTPDRQLRLITCGGVFDHRLRSYKDNLVVYAVAG
jgi:hypothetical protein